MNNKVRILYPSIGIALVVVGIFAIRGAKTAPENVNAIITDVPVTITTVTKQKLASNLSLVGTINANNDINVVSETQGVAKSVLVKVGDRVSNGSVLVQVDDEIQRSSLAAAQINHEKARRDYERSEALYQENSISVSQLDAARLGLKAAENQLDIARRALENTRIKSPIAGMINARMVDVGTMVGAGTTVANVIDISTLKVRINVSEREAFRLKTGDTVQITTDVYPGVAFTGKINNVASKADEAHTYAVEINTANNAAHPLKAGMFARVTFLSLDPTESLVIPRFALIGSIKQAQVFVLHAGIAELRTVIIGKQTANLLEVLHGVAFGDSIVTNGQNNLTDRSKVVVLTQQPDSL